jgi:hypothetical protein
MTIARTPDIDITINPDGSVTDNTLANEPQGGIISPREMDNMTNQNISAGSQDDVIVWPEKSEPISQEAYKGLRAYAGGHGVHLSGFKASDVDVELAREVIDDCAKMMAQYPDLFGGKPFTIMLSRDMNVNDFAEVLPGSPHILRLNADAYRSKAVLAREYAKLADEGWFVKGTDYHHIVYHEFGHMIESVYKIDGMKLAQDVLGFERLDTIKYLSVNLSIYSAGDGNEVISEMFSASKKQNSPDFVLIYMRKLDNIITKKGAV